MEARLNPRGHRIIVFHKFVTISVFSPFLLLPAYMPDRGLLLDGQQRLLVSYTGGPPVMSVTLLSFLSLKKRHNNPLPEETTEEI